MRIPRAITRVVLPLSLLAAGGCAGTRLEPVKATPPPVVQAVPPKVDRYGRTIAHYSDLASAIEPILAKGSQILLLGEIHKMKKSSVISTTQHFAREVIPLLAKYGYRDLVLEDVPRGPEVEAELAEYYRSERFGPILAKLLRISPDRFGTLEVLIQCRKLGITIHGANHLYRSEEQLNRETEDLSLSQRIKANMIDLVTSLKKQDKLVAVWGGADHNNRNGKMQFSIKPWFPEAQEVDIYQGDFILTLEQSEIDVEGIFSLVPEDGASQVTYQNGRVVILLPYQHKRS